MTPELASIRRCNWESTPGTTGNRFKCCKHSVQIRGGHHRVKTQSNPSGFGGQFTSVQLADVSSSFAMEQLKYTTELP
jgi:hypothetical protein